MDISEIDKNLTVYVTLPEDIEWFDIRQEPLPFTVFWTTVRTAGAAFPMR